MHAPDTAQVQRGSATPAEPVRADERAETGAAGAGSATARLLAIRAEPLSVDEVLAAVRAPDAGGLALFAGTVRDEDGGRSVTRLDYEAHPQALPVLADVAAQVAAQYPVRALAAVHRTGSLQVGDLAVVVAVACAHRAEAFAACRQLIDDLKARVPIWKSQSFTDGGQEWVGCP